MPATQTRIDCLQYCGLSRARFKEMRAGGLQAAHVTVAYHEDFRGVANNIAEWNEMFNAHSDLVFPARAASDIETARKTKRTAIYFGLQNCAPMENDVRMLEVLHALGVRFMQLTYNKQSPLAGGCLDAKDGGITKAGREAIAEMNRLGMVIDLSHIGERSLMQALKISKRPAAVTHAGPKFWRDTPRHLSNKALKALSESGAMLGLSLYPHHLKDGSKCTLQSFCEMAARTAEITGAQNLGIGSDLCRGRDDSVLRWMRDGNWRRRKAKTPKFPQQPKWFNSAADFDNLNKGLKAAGFNKKETDGILGENWLRFFKQSLTPASEKGRGKQ